ncbi:MAG: hypothetical protein PHO01_07290 [Desulfotomaculaceae bacterium]|nr:hypothetical protein [Desulfotomaculaceae bacterium]
MKLSRCKSCAPYLFQEPICWMIIKTVITNISSKGRQQPRLIWRKAVSALLLSIDQLAGHFHLQARFFTG